MTILLSYIAAFVTTMLVTNLAFVSLLLFKPLCNKFPFLIPVTHFFAATVGAFSAVFVYGWIADKTFLVMAYFIVLLPAIFLIWNNTRRVSRAKAGVSGVRKILDSWEEPYDQKIDVLNEQLSGTGFIVGFLIATIFIVGDVGFLS